jgi:phospholipase C
MRKMLAKLLLAVLTLFAFGSGICINAGAQEQKPWIQETQKSPPDLSAIQQFVFIIKENRSFDTYFGTFEPPPYGATTGMISTGQIIPLQHAPDGIPRSPGYQWADGKQVIDYGRMDKFDLEEKGNINGDYLPYSQLYQSDIPNYWSYASTYALGDQMFVPLTGPSFPNHMYAVAAQSGGAVGNFEGSDVWSCDAPPQTTVEVIDAKGTLLHEFPCFDFQTLGDSLEAAGIDWSLYATADSNWNPFQAINHVKNNPTLWNQHIFDEANFASDAAKGALPAVTWLIPDDADSEHPSNSSCVGENWTVNQINAIMQGPQWGTTAIFIVWDDWGGLYDHYPPPTLDQFGLGVRVTLIVISPFVKGGTISHTQYEFSSFLKLVEERFGLSPLTTRDAIANDMLDNFDFTQTQPPLILSTRNCSPASTATLNFPPQLVGTASPSKTVTITDFSTTTPLTINSIKLSGPDFSQNNTCGNRVKPGQNCTINVAFNPQSAGARTGTLTITDGDVTSPQVVQLTGTGTQVVLSPQLVKFGNIFIGKSSKTLTAQLQNVNRNSGLTISGIVPAGDYSEIDNCGGGLPAGGSCNLTVTFTPTAAGTRYGSLTITDSDGGSPHVLNLSGTGTELNFSQIKLTFPNQAIGTSSAPLSFNMNNNGSSAISIDSVQFIGSNSQTSFDYSQSNNCNGLLNPQSTCTFSVTFTPGAVGSRNGDLLIFTSETATSPEIITLIGSAVANSVPFINQPLVPADIQPGNNGFTLTVNGTGFAPSSTVNWNGVPLTTNYINTHQLGAQVPSANCQTAGTAAITVVNPAPGGGTSNTAYFPIADSETSVPFSANQFATGNQASAAAAGDFNGDGKPDLAITNKGDASVTVLLGNGDGTFTAAPLLSVGQGPAAIVAADFNNDGKLDLAVANSADNTASILLGNGDGTFIPVVATVPTQQLPLAIAVGDLNKDGRLDLAIVNNGENCVSVLTGNGDGTFHLETSPVTGSGPTSVAIGDVFGTGNLSLVVSNGIDSTLSVIPGNGDGTFLPGTTYSTGASPSSVVLTDLNGDGVLDAASANQDGGTVSVLLGKGENGQFQNHVDFAANTAPSALVAADFNGNGLIDLAVANSGASSVSILLGNGDGTFQTNVDYAVGTSPAGLALSDFNLDGELDLAVPGSSANIVSILLQ